MIADPFLRHDRNLQAVLLKIAEMAIAMDSNIPKLDPIRAYPNLLQKVNDAVIVRDVW